MGDTLLEIRNLKTFFDVRGAVLKAVDDVDISIEAGQTLGLVGESGCGKSVTAASIMGLIPSPPGRIAGGQILFEGVNLLDLPDRVENGCMVTSAEPAPDFGQ